MRFAQSAIGGATLLLAPSLAFANGSVHVVDDVAGPGVDFTDLQTAIDAAAPGDLLLVKTGTYAGFGIDGKSITITADAGAVVSVGPVIVENLLATQSVALSGLSVANNFGIGMTLADNLGPVFIERSSVFGSGLALFQFIEGLNATNCAQLTLSECSISAVGAPFGGFDGMGLYDSTTYVYESSVVGDKGFDGQVGGAGCHLVGGFLFASGSTFTGGEGGNGTLASPFMICFDGAQGGPGLELVQSFSGSTPTAIELDCNFVGGAGGPPPPGTTCVTGPAGPPTAITSGTLTSIPVNARTYAIPSPIRGGTTGNLVFSGLPGELAWVVLSGSQQHVYSPLFQGLVLPKQPSPIIFVGTIPASGTLSLPVNVTLQPGQECLVVYEQAIYYTIPSGFVLSNPRLGVIVDPAF